MIYLDVAKKIEKLREKLHESINRNGLSSKETQKISSEVDKLVNVYYKQEKKYEEDNDMLIAYNRSIEELKQLTIDLGDFPNVKIWTEYAKRNNCLSYISIEYISGLNWHKLASKIKL